MEGEDEVEGAARSMNVKLAKVIVKLALFEGWDIERPYAPTMAMTHKVGSSTTAGISRGSVGGPYTARG